MFGIKKYVDKLIKHFYAVSPVQVKNLGGGFYGKVFSAAVSGKTVVVKFYLKSGICKQEMLQLKALKSAAILKVPEVYHIHLATDDVPYDAIIMEYIEGQNAGNIHNLQADKRMQLAEQIVDNLIAVHSVTNPLGFGDVDANEYTKDWQSLYKPEAKIILDKSEQLFEKNKISRFGIETVRLAYRNFDDIFNFPIKRSSLIHGDYNTWNILIDENQCAIAMIDPYKCRFGDPEYDLYQLNNANGKELGLFEMYQSKYNLSENSDIKIAFYELFTELMHYYDSGVKPDKENIDKLAEKLKNIM